ncbi:Uncharacterised protein [Segatella copri]|nr:Uncharacterised protein [Segatella copri]
MRRSILPRTRGSCLHSPCSDGLLRPVLSSESQPQESMF